MKILYVITGLGQGGAERVVCDLADRMYESGHEVKVAYLVGDILTRPIHNEIELIKVDLNGVAALPSAYVTLSKIIKNYNPDVVHSHMVHANILTRLIRITTPVKKLICTAHNSDEGGNIRMGLYRATHHLADITTNVSNTATKSFEKKKAVPKNGMKTIYNGVNLNNFKYNPSAREEVNSEFLLESDVKVLLSVGRFNEQKNYPNLLNAIKILKEKNQLPFKLLIAGDGELRETIENLIQQLDLEENIILLGRRSDIPRLMSACDVFILSSDYEGLPTVLIEALACQAHIVSTDVSGAREIVSENSGKIVQINDSYALSNAIYETMLNSTSKNTLGCTAVRKKFNLDTVADSWISIYNEK
ncbi:glycosyltransferase [Acinetobacter johnsonii]|uniref:glycosyltransferase n=1 Tax=Acinetobacter johnsonii TaxID=40214 RepID=UPI0032B51159